MSFVLTPSGIKSWNMQRPKTKGIIVMPTPVAAANSQMRRMNKKDADPEVRRDIDYTVLGCGVKIGFW